MYTLNIHFETENVQGYDPETWRLVESVETIEEAIFLLVKHTEYGAGMLTSMEVKVLNDAGETVLSTGTLFPDNMKDARIKYYERQQEGEERDAALWKEVDPSEISDEDLPF